LIIAYLLLNSTSSHLTLNFFILPLQILAPPISCLSSKSLTRSPALYHNLLCSSRSTVTLVRMSLHSWRALAVSRPDDIRTPGILILRENSERLDWSWPIYPKASAQIARHCSVLSFSSCNRSRRCSEALTQIARHCLMLSFSFCSRSRSAATSSELDREEWICISRRCTSRLAVFVILSLDFVRVFHRA
jgi:hypothetical protein